MRCPALLTATLLAAVCPPAQSPAPTAPPRHDVVVYGGTSAGIAAALAAARHGRTVLLLEPTRRLGGLTTNGLGATDIGNKAAIGGISREFYQRVRAHYARDEAWVQQEREDFRGRGHRPGEDAAWTFEPKVALAIYRQMLGEQPAIDVELEARLVLRDDSGVVREGARIVALRTTDGRQFAGRIFVDASYEGDLLAKAEVPYRVGREANAEYGETLNGVQFANAVHHQFSHDVDPYVVPGDPDSGLLRWIQPGDPGTQGAADHRVQAYCFRLCTTDVADNRRPWTAPEGYDPQDFELLLRNIEAGDLRKPWHPVRMPNRKTDTNNNFAISLDAIGLSWRWPEAHWEERTTLFAEHRYYTAGLLHTLAHHERVPEEMRAHFRTWGRARDEFVESDGWPQQLYVREGRRMVGDVVMTEHHCRGSESVPDPVGLGAYGMDSHNVQRYVTGAGTVRNEGDVQVHGFSPYGISYRAIVPPRGSVTNLLVPAAVSATHIAFGSLRMEPVFMVLGHSAGVAADRALDAHVAVQDLPYAPLAAALEAEGQVLHWTGPRRTLPPPEALDPTELPGIVADDAGAELSGAWLQSTSVSPFVGTGYRHDDGRADPGTRARFTLRAPARGRYHVELAWQPHANRAADVAVVVEHGDRRSRTSVDQRQPPADDGLWRRLDTVELRRGESLQVVVRPGGGDGHVIVDAVRLLPVDDDG